MMIVGLGENSVDYVYRLPWYPQPGTATSKVRIEERHVHPGGQVATTLATCAQFGLPARYLGVFGDDAAGALIREALLQRRVDVSRAMVRHAPNRHALILVDASHGERVVLWQRDPHLAIGPGDVGAADIARATLVHVDATDEEASIALARRARAAGLPVTSDIDQVTPLTAALIDAVSIPMFAEHVPHELTGEADIEGALRALRRTHGGTLVVTLGARGAAMLDGEHFLQVPACHVDVTDSTGAGDVFRGAFIYAMLNGSGPEAILQFANAAAAVSCTREGAIDGVPTMEEVDDLRSAAYGPGKSR